VNVNSNPHERGRLLSLWASFVYSFSGELLKWQFPFAAAGEKAARVVALVRGAFFPLASPTAQR
jgi:hypothetical protein